MRVSCFPVFEMVESNHKGVSRSWSLALNESLLEKRLNDNLRSAAAKYLGTPFSLCAPEVSSAHRNNTNLFTRLGNVGYWRVEISRNHSGRKKCTK